MLRRVSLVYLSPLLVAVLGIAVLRTVRERGAVRLSEAADGEDLFREVMTVIRTRHVADVDPDALTLAAVQAMAESTDPWTRVFDRAAWAAFNEENDGAFGGVGIRWYRIGGRPTVVSVKEGGPAAAAGLRPGDEIAEVGNEKVPEASEGADAQGEVLARIRGPRGSRVRIGVRRPGAGDLLRLDVTRAVIESASVSFHTLGTPAGAGYIRIHEFHRRTADEFRDAVRSLRGAGLTALVLDLRLNSGGVLRAATDVADELLPGGPIVRTVWRDRSLWTLAEERAALPDTPLVVLVDRHTGSAAEILAGALQDRRRAVLVGERTWGKGVVQDVLELDSRPGLGMKITTAHYLTPALRVVEKSVGLRSAPAGGGGVIPDFAVAVNAEALRFAWLLAECEDDLRRRILVEASPSAGAGHPGDQALEFAVRLLSGDPAVLPLRAQAP